MISNVMLVRYTHLGRDQFKARELAVKFILDKLVHFLVFAGERSVEPRVLEIVSLIHTKIYHVPSCPPRELS